LIEIKTFTWVTEEILLEEEDDGEDHLPFLWEEGEEARQKVCEVSHGITKDDTCKDKPQSQAS
jgi:hypothetical protein